MDQLLTVEQAAAYLGGISVWTVRAWLQKRKLKPTKIGRRTMVKTSELDRLIAQGDRETSEETKRGGQPQTAHVVCVLRNNCAYAEQPKSNAPGILNQREATRLNEPSPQSSTPALAGTGSVSEGTELRAKGRYSNNPWMNW
jgi:excisionase family DNA binding protein